jgi:hypothetical protein
MPTTSNWTTGTRTKRRASSRSTTSDSCYRMTKIPKSATAWNMWSMGALARKERDRNMAEGHIFIPPRTYTLFSEVLDRPGPHLICVGSPDNPVDSFFDRPLFRQNIEPPSPQNSLSFIHRALSLILTQVTIKSRAQHMSASTTPPGRVSHNEFDPTGHGAETKWTNVACLAYLLAACLYSPCLCTAKGSKYWACRLPDAVPMLRPPRSMQSKKESSILPIRK